MDNTKKTNITDSLLSLEVPQVKEIRYSIRKEVDAYFEQENVMPPVSYDTLVEKATLLIETKGWPEHYKAFVMVCCGNAIWREIVGSVPHNRRILLLPKCLKNSMLCKAEQDELGLLCSECGGCTISGFLREAENLGYVAIVTEGTSIAARLIESGKVDAVIGVGCMEVLQKMFVSVSKYSIPSIGIPLITCGCVDTLADSEWIKEEIYQYHENLSYRLLNLNYLRNRTSSIFGEEQLNRIMKLSNNSTEQLALESLLAGGKRLRPLLTVLAFDAFSDHIDTEDLNRLALSVECFHKASLIHDDIEDEDSMRYGKETLHECQGIPVAINIGDLLIGEGYRLIAETSFAPQVIQECIKVVSRGHRSLSIGQGIELMSMKKKEILSLSEVLFVFENKTAAAFKASILLGAVAGGADAYSLELLEQFSLYIGVAYQIKDDLEDFNLTDDKFKLEKPSLLISMLFEKLSLSQQIIFQNACSTLEVGIIQQFVDEYQIRQNAEELLKDYISKSNDCLMKFNNIGLKLALHEILGKTFKDYI
jgi:geranylgeranyl pyrophosphate synthase